MIHAEYKTPSRFFAAAFLALSGFCTIYAAQKPDAPAQKTGATLNNPTVVVSGSRIYAAKCEICHFSKSKAKKIGPGLANIYPGGKFANGKKVDDASMRLWIELGGKDMPGYKESLKPGEIRDLIAYLRTL
jgi:cytochrome c2